MIDYLIPHSPDQRIFQRASQHLKDGKLICFPLESHWDILCDPHQKMGVEKLYQYRKVDQKKHFTLICDNLSMASQFAYVPDNAFHLMKKLTPGSYTFILKAQKLTTKWLKASKADHQVGIRIPDIDWIRKFISFYQSPLIGTHLSLPDETIPLYSALIEEELHQFVDYIIDPGEIEFTESSSIIDFSIDGSPQIIRRGAGDLSFFK
jgi:tRNA threonylcarbamoyl adenosine modification protein (Sua5/YciO/YrdC/YwlC family)